MNKDIIKQFEESLNRVYDAKFNMNTAMLNATATSLLPGLLDEYKAPIYMNCEDEIRYLNWIVDGKFTIKGVYFMVGQDGSENTAWLRMLLHDKTDTPKWFFTLKYNPKKDGKSSYPDYTEKYNAVMRMVEDVISNPITEFTNGKFDYL